MDNSNSSDSHSYPMSEERNTIWHVDDIELNSLPDEIDIKTEIIPDPLDQQNLENDKHLWNCSKCCNLAANLNVLRRNIGEDDIGINNSSDFRQKQPDVSQDFNIEVKVDDMELNLLHEEIDLKPGIIPISLDQRNLQLAKVIKSPRKSIIPNSSDQRSLVNVIKSPRINSVASILKTGFSCLSLKKQLEIIELGRPAPTLNLTQKKVRKAENRSYSYRFSSNTYEKYSWLCGCDISNLLYCWPCLLFYEKGMDKNWARVGLEDLQHLSAKMKKHQISKHHINCYTSYFLFGKQNSMAQLSSAYRQSVAAHNEQVRKNRYILKRIISCIRFCGAFEIAIRGNNESGSFQNKEMYRELLDFAAELDSVLKEHLNNDSVFGSNTKTIQNEILDCMYSVCKEEIARQIDESDFLSIQFDETTDVSNNCQMVFILRYVLNGQVHERFWRFSQIKDKTPEALKNLVEQEIDPLILKSPQKLIALSHDGTALRGEISVQEKIKEKYPYAHFLHCYAHHLNHLVQKVASQNSRVRVFFLHCFAIPAFFSSSTHRCDILQNIVKNRLPNVAKTGWKYNIGAVTVIYENQNKLIELFQEVESKCLKDITVREAYGLRKALEDQEFLFWLTFFHKIMPHIYTLYNQLQSRNKDSIKIQNNISDFEKSVCEIRDQTDDIQDNIDSNFVNIKQRRINDEDRRSVIAKEVCDTIVVEMKERFTYRGHLEAAELLNPSRFPKYTKRFPLIAFDRVSSFYPMLSKPSLRSELEVFYMRDDFRSISGAMNILSFFLQNKLSEIFPETQKLLNIILTTPITTVEPERCFSTLKQIKTFLRNTMDNDRLNALAMMSINKSLVNNIDCFEERVLAKFILMKHRQTEFHFKD